MLRLVQPWPDPYTINARSPFGPRVHPITGKRTFHHGIDVAMPVGTPLRAGADGVVAHKGQGGSGGVTLLLKHANNMHTVYYHLQKPSSLPVGAAVKAGDVVAYSGNTGASTGPHLHYELRRSRNWGDTLDPAPAIVRMAPETAPMEPADILSEPEPVPRPVHRGPVIPTANTWQPPNPFAQLQNRVRAGLRRRPRG